MHMEKLKNQNKKHFLTIKANKLKLYISDTSLRFQLTMS